jgi:rare lipoprotein A
LPGHASAPIGLSYFRVGGSACVLSVAPMCASQQAERFARIGRFGGGGFLLPSCCSRPDGVRSVLSSHEPNGLTTSQSAKVCSVAHAHRHFTTQTLTARRKGASYALASFYGEDSETASGEKFNSNELTAAHPTLPFGTRLRVTNVVNGRSVIVRVNDRGPFVRGRAVDVSSSAS